MTTRRGGTSQTLTDRMRQSGNTTSLIQSTVKLQNIVRKIEAEIRSREGEPVGLTARFEMKMSPEQKQWVTEAMGIRHARRKLVQQPVAVLAYRTDSAAGCCTKGSMIVGRG